MGPPGWVNFFTSRCEFYGQQTKSKNMKTTSIGKEKALELYGSGWWKEKTAKEVAVFQMTTNEPCMPFGDFHEALEKALGRPVWTHELAMNRDGIMEELLNGKPAPSMEEIIGLIPKEKLMVVVAN